MDIPVPTSLKPKYPATELWHELDWSFEQGAIQFIDGPTTGTEASTNTASPRIGRTRVCTSLTGRTTSELARKAGEAFTQGTDLVEFRIDLLRSPNFDDIEADLSGFRARSVVTVRPVSEGGGFEGDETDRLALLRSLARLKPAYFDVELRTLEAGGLVAPRGQARNIIVSWHDLTGTGDRRRLLSVMRRAASYADLVKIVTTATDPADNLTILSLYERNAASPIAFCMGPQGMLSRVMAIELGTPIAYASLPDEPTASGQLPLGLLLAIRRRLESD